MTQLKALGGLRLESSPFTQPKPLVLLSYLSLEGSQQRKHLAELFWTDGHRLKALSMTLTRLRQGVGEVVEVDDKQAKAKLPCDAKDLLESLDKSQWQRVSELYTGAFLEGVVLEDWSSELEEWVYTTREYLAERVQYALLNLAEEVVKRQDFEKARDHAERAYKLPGLGGTEITSLKRLYPLLSASNSLLAPEVRKELDGYGITVQLSRDEAKAKFQEDKIATQLPTRQTSFVGRDEELTELATMLTNVQLLTLLGTGGVGKTRLALQLAYEQQKLNAFEGVYFVSLESLTSPDLILPTMLSTLGLNQQSKTEPLSQLIDFIAGRSVLLVLDNLEHLVENVNVLSDLIKKCPNLKLLVTSRERLGLEEEHLFPLEGLAYPTANLTFEEVKNVDAVALFSQRAQQLYPQFELRDHLDAVLRICKLVEGLPLGLELAASWVRLMSCNEIANEIERGLEFLTTTTHNIPERHRSLKAAFDYSWKLLTQKEQEVLRKLSVFVGGFRREAASEVTGATIPLLASLVDKSLLRVLPNGRYGRHPLLSQFTQEKLAGQAREQEQTRERYGQYYLQFLERTGQQIRKGEQREALGKLEEEQFNVFAAWHWASGKQLFEKMQQGRKALTILFDERGRYQEGESFFAETIKACAVPESSGKQLAAYVLGDRAWFVYSIGDFPKATRLGEESLVLMRSLDDRAGLTKALNVLACIAMDSGQFGDAQVYLQEMLAVARSLHDQYSTSIALLNLGNLKYESNKLGEAEHYYREAVSLCRQEKDSISLVGALNDLAVVLRKTHRIQEAFELLEESLSISQPMELRTSQLYTLAELAEVYFQLGNLQRALEYARESLALAELTDNKRQQIHNLELLGRLYTRLHEPEKARHYFSHSLKGANEVKDTPRMLRAIIGIAELCTIVSGEWFEVLQTIVNHSAMAREDKARVYVLLEKKLPIKASKNMLPKSLEQVLELVLENSDSTKTVKV